MRHWRWGTAPLTVVILLLIAAFYNVAEGLASTITGLLSGSLTLLAFGADSYLEVAASLAVLWRLHFLDPEAGERAEVRVLRLVGASLVLLAVAVLADSAWSLAKHHAAAPSTSGLVVVAASLVVMPILAFWKLRAAARGALPALGAEARETVACAYLSVSAVVGLLFLRLTGWWFVDAVSALLLVPWLLKEGLEGLRGDACFDGSRPCFCRPCLYGLRDCRPAAHHCVPACC